LVSDPQVRVQTPPLQTWPVPQALPQVPQLALSVIMFAQYGAPVEGMHLVSDPQVRVQTPLLQTWPAPQPLPQVPQLALSVIVLAQ
jgi:hypothetical protein